MMAEAAALAQGPEDRPLTLARFDTGGTVSGAASAAKQAVAGGAQLLLGPLFSEETEAALGAIDGAAPLVSFSNDGALRGSGGFVMGLEPAQPVSAILRFAKQRGVGSAGVLGEAGNIYDSRAAVAATRISKAIGIASSEPVILPSSSSGADALMWLRETNAGVLPDAVLIPSAGPLFDAAAPALAAAGVQILGTAQAYARPGIDSASASANVWPELGSAWFAAPDPAGFAVFAQLMQARTGAEPGFIASLAHDAVLAARTLAVTGQMGRTGLLRPQGFEGVGGTFRFEPSGLCRRDLVILTMNAEGPVVVAGGNR